MPSNKLRHDLGSATRLRGEGRTNSMQTIRMTLEAASMMYTGTEPKYASTKPPASGPSVAANCHDTLRHMAALEKIRGGTKSATIAVEAGHPSARNAPVPNRNA